MPWKLRETKNKCGLELVSRDSKENMESGVVYESSKVVERGG